MKKPMKFKIKADDTKLAIGHQSHISGAGVHDNRPRRERTRGDQRRSWKKDQGYE